MIHQLDEGTLSSNIIGFLIWLLWVSVVVLVLGGAAYLFVGGSTLFAQQTQLPLVVYRQVQDGEVALTGSILLPSKCHRLTLKSHAEESLHVLDFRFDKIQNCHLPVVAPVPETYSIVFAGSEDTIVQAIVMGANREILIK